MTYARGTPRIQVDNTLAIPVAYTLTDNTVVEVEVAVFVTAGMTEADITEALDNRGISEQSRYDNIKAAQALLEQLQS